MTAPARAPKHATNTANSGAHVDAVLEGFLLRASVRGESAVALARAVICALALLRVFAFYFEDLAAFQVKPWVSASGIAAGLLFSVIAFIRLRGERRAELRLYLSVIVDTCVLMVALVPIIRWPHADYRGILREIDLAAMLLVVVAAGARLSPRVALAGATSNIAAFTAFVLLDRAWNSTRVGYPLGDVVLGYVLILGAGTLAWSVAKGTRRLVVEGAEAVLRAERARQRLGVYVSEEVAAALDKNDEAPALGGSKREVAVLFSDLRGFTRFAERLDPESLVTELNAYLDVMVQAVRAEGGVIDKYIGDSIMALFGVPEERPDAGGGEPRAAAAMERALRAHNAARALAGRPRLAHGIGVHYGPCVWGNIGSQERMQYTVIGDTVNLASRLESATKERGVSVLVSGETVRAAGDRAPRVTSQGTIQVRGREQALEVFTLEDVQPS